MISDEAVEAALRAWGVSGEAPRNIAKCILEAAAPYMLAEAWEEGCEEGLSWNPGYDDKALAENPYRSQP